MNTEQSFYGLEWLNALLYCKMHALCFNGTNMHFCRKMKYVAKMRFLGILLAQTNEICRHVIGDIVTLFTLGSLKFTLITLFLILTTLYVIFVKMRHYFCQIRRYFYISL